MFYGKWLLSCSGTEMFWGSLRSAHFFTGAQQGPCWWLDQMMLGVLCFSFVFQAPWSFLEGRTFLSRCLTLSNLWKHLAMGFCCCWMCCCIFTLSYMCAILFIHSFIHSYIHWFIDLEILYLLSPGLGSRAGVKSHSICPPDFWFIDFYGPWPDGTSILGKQNTDHPYSSNKHLLDIGLDLWGRAAVMPKSLFPKSWTDRWGGGPVLSALRVLGRHRGKSVLEGQGSRKASGEMSLDRGVGCVKERGCTALHQADGKNRMWWRTTVTSRWSEQKVYE